jgi:D-3-phosphoglycerate dehydrogenase
MAKGKVLLLENISAVAVEVFRDGGYEVESLKAALDEQELIAKLNDEKLSGAPVSILGVRSKTRVSAAVIEAACNKEGRLALDASQRTRRGAVAPPGPSAHKERAPQDDTDVELRSVGQPGAAVPTCPMRGLVAVGAFCIGVDKIDRAAANEHGVAVFNDPHSNSRSVAELAMGEIILLVRRIFSASTQMHTGVWNKSAAGAHEVRGLTLGIVGYGKIGSQLSDLAEAMGMRVVFYDENRGVFPIQA